MEINVFFKIASVLANVIDLEDLHHQQGALMRRSLMKEFIINAQVHHRPSVRSIWIDCPFRVSSVEVACPWQPRAV
jgi:hypothetical protein